MKERDKGAEEGKGKTLKLRVHSIQKPRKSSKKEKKALRSVNSCKMSFKTEKKKQKRKKKWFNHKN